MNGKSFIRCIRCKEPFTDANVRTPLGWKETQISGLCELCWDIVTQPEEEEDKDDV